MYTALIALAAVAALPAADGKPTKTSAPETEATTSDAGQAAAKPEATRYCVVDVPTGSHVRHKTCRTRQEWMKMGFDPLDDR